MSEEWKDIDRFTPVKIEFKYGITKKEYIIDMIIQYFYETKTECFTYKELRIWMYRKPKYKNIEWHTVERTVRHMAETGKLKRVWLSKNKVKFCKQKSK